MAKDLKCDYMKRDRSVRGRQCGQPAERYRTVDSTHPDRSPVECVRCLGHWPLIGDPWVVTRLSDGRVMTEEADGEFLLTW